jgi:hypothetical protein
MATPAIENKAITDYFVIRESSVGLSASDLLKLIFDQKALISHQSFAQLEGIALKLLDQVPKEADSEPLSKQLLQQLIIGKYKSEEILKRLYDSAIPDINIENPWILLSQLEDWKKV